MLELKYGYNPRVEEFKRAKRAKEYGYEEGPRPDLRWNGDEDELEDGYTYKLEVEDDYDVGDPGDNDMVLGTLTEYPEKESSWKIDPEDARSHYHRTGMRTNAYYFDLQPELWWNPMEELKDYQDSIAKGASKQVARELATANEKKMRDRLLGYPERWNYVVVTVSCHRAGVEVGSNSLGGVESDFFENGFAEELIPEMAAQAKEEADLRIDNMLRIGAGLPTVNSNG